MTASPDSSPIRFRWRTAILRPAGPPATSRLVACALAEHLDHNGVAWPSAETLSDATGLSERSVRTHLETLERQGWLIRLTAGGVAGGTRTSRWQATIPERGSEVTPERASPTSEESSEVVIHTSEPPSGVTPTTSEPLAATSERRSDEPGFNLEQAAAAARELVVDRRRRRELAATKNDPAGWLRGAVAGIDTEIAELQALHRDWTAQQLADELAPPLGPPSTGPPQPVDEPDHAGCQTCDGHGNILLPDPLDPDSIVVSQVRCDGPNIALPRPKEHTAA